MLPQMSDHGYCLCWAAQTLYSESLLSQESRLEKIELISLKNREQVFIRFQLTFNITIIFPL